MPVDRALARAARRASASIHALGDEYRVARITAGLTQGRVAALVGTSRARYTRVEAGLIPSIRIDEATRIAAVLGLDLVVRAYPGAGPPRDAAHARKLDGLLAHTRPPLHVRREVGLPSRDDYVELRAWDAEVAGDGQRTRFELEMRLTDLQAQERRLQLKLRDDPADRFVLVVADTHRNRLVLRASPGFFADLPRLGPGRVIRALEAGEHPPSCLIVL